MWLSLWMCFVCCTVLKQSRMGLYFQFMVWFKPVSVFVAVWCCSKPECLSNAWRGLTLSVITFFYGAEVKQTGLLCLAYMCYVYVLCLQFFCFLKWLLGLFTNLAWVFFGYFVAFCLAIFVIPFWCISVLFVFAKLVTLCVCVVVSFVYYFCLVLFCLFRHNLC